MRCKILKNPSRWARINVANLRYADDVVLPASSMQELEILVTRVKDASEQSGLLLNTQKNQSDEDD